VGIHESYGVLGIEGCLKRLNSRRVINAAFEFDIATRSYNRGSFRSRFQIEKGKLVPRCLQPGPRIDTEHNRAVAEEEAATTPPDNFMIQDRLLLANDKINRFGGPS
jgi:hypothetical protein